MNKTKLSKQQPTEEQPSMRWMLGSVNRVLAFGLGSGLISPAPGTWGTLVGWLLWVAAVQFMPAAFMPWVLLVAFVWGCQICHTVGRQLGQPDHSGIVFDEIVAIWIVLWLGPASLAGQLMAFVVFRFFDILKPFPIKYFDVRLPNGFGVMLDDLLAAVYSVLFIAIVVKLGWVV